jgi:RNA polymerase sigma-70 factor (ECF subfamily)
VAYEYARGRGASDRHAVTDDVDREHRWVRQIASGDRAAFEELYRAYQKRVFGYLFRLLNRVDLAEEVTTDVMVEAWRSAATFRGDSKVSTWLFGIARFKGLTAARRSRADTVNVEAAGALADPRELPEQVLIKAGTADAVRQALARLSDDHREVMELTFFQGFSYPEIAAIVDCPVNTVKTRMFHARKQLRQLLAAEGVS